MDCLQEKNTYEKAGVDTGYFQHWFTNFSTLI